MREIIMRYSGEGEDLHDLKRVGELVRWRDVAGYEGYYKVNQFGDVVSLSRTIHVIDGNREYDKPIKGGLMRQHTQNKGYKVVCLTKNGVTKNIYVHRIVANAFIPNNNNMPMINHKDEDKTNNYYENLEWCDARYNNIYGTKIQRRVSKLKGRSLMPYHRKRISDAIKKHYRIQKMLQIIANYNAQRKEEA